MAKDFTESTLSSHTSYRGRLLNLKDDEVRLPDGGAAKREYIDHIGAACILPLFEDYSVLLEHQYRYTMRAHLVELPAGKLEPGEDPLTSAKRELLEETGYVAGHWRALTTLYPCVGYSNERLEMFLARELRFEGHPGEDGEFIETMVLPLDDALERVRRGEINDAKTIVGLLWAQKLRHGDWP